MRTVTFSNAQVQKYLNQNFVGCITNTHGDRSAGASFAHQPSDAPGPCGRGAGRQNVQTVFLTPQGELLHVASGYLSAQVLLEEMKFARQLWEQLKTGDESRKRQLVDEHRKRLHSLGYNDREISKANDPGFDLKLKSLSPADIGLDIPSFPVLGMPENMPVSLGQDVSKVRVLKDHDFVMKNPLVSVQQFDRNVTELVGQGTSFFGSHSSLKEFVDGFNQQSKPLRERLDGRASID